MADSLLSGFRALDLTDEKGFVCGQILATMGVNVIKIEKPGGDQARNIPPFCHNTPDPEKSLYWLAFNTDKLSITLNLEDRRGQDLFRKLAEKADFVIESFAPGYMDSLGLGYEALSRLNPRIIMTSITNFGQKGPYSQYRGSELIATAMGGVMDNIGDMDRPPVKEALDAVCFQGSAAAALGTVISHYSRELTGEGQQIDVSLQEVGASRTTLCLLPWQWYKCLVKRAPPMNQPGLPDTKWLWTCKDGYVYWPFNAGMRVTTNNQALFRWLDDDKIKDSSGRVTNWEKLDISTMTAETRDSYEAAIRKFFLKHTKKEIADGVLKRGTNATVASDPDDVTKDHHLAARNFWVELDHPELDITAAYPRHFFLSSETENYVRRRAPHIGEDNDKIFGRELGLSATELAGLREANVI